MSNRCPLEIPSSQAALEREAHRLGEGARGRVVGKCLQLAGGDRRYRVLRAERPEDHELVAEPRDRDLGHHGTFTDSAQDS
jgi:hypothetical protein